MILDQLKNAADYTGLSTRIKQSLAFLKENSFDGLDDGRHEIDGDNLFFIVARYDTKPCKEGLLEAHRKYIDVQYMAKGREIMGYAPTAGLITETAYNTEKDCEFYHLAENTTALHFEQGMFGIFYPQDAHLPGRHVDVAESVYKVVVKVLLNK